MISDPRMSIAVTAGAFSLYKAANGSGQADFYHCKSCNQLLVVGATLAGVSLGAVNSFLFGNLNQLGEPILVQPRLLSPGEKVARWSKIWGRLQVSYA
jgi:hypothetical protein